MRVRAILSYDGTEYAGYQRQADVPTVQEAVETALADIGQGAITISGSGRTDAGVHAAGQVIAFDTSWRHGLEALQRALNAVLPDDVAVREVEEASADFHPRFDAQRRHYRYRIFNGPVRWPMARRFSLHVPYPLDVDWMRDAAEALVGEHDFATFGQPPQGDVTVRRVFRTSWRQGEPGGGPFGSELMDGPILAFDIEANAYLYRMVRSIVGTLLEVGQGRLSVSGFQDAFAARERGRAGQTAPPQGLCLMKVTY
jgi:tRNA pseudouridine38-40 synthase